MSPVATLRTAALLGALGVTMGAFGAHGLREHLDAYSLDIYQTAVTYQMSHVPALLAVGLLGLLAPSRPSAATSTLTVGEGSVAVGRVRRSLTLAGWSFLLGILIFSGTLYLLSVTGIRWLGAITPIGGVFLIVGWVLLAIAVGTAGWTGTTEV